VSDREFSTRVLRDDCLLIEAGRTLDNSNAGQLIDTITQAQDRGYKFIILDCSSLKRLSSAGVGSILGTVETSRTQGGDIVLCHLSAAIHHVLDVLDLTGYLTIESVQEEAIARCAPEARG
jgi:stage II sporulation protein AA (anti-sigma F factor antagonist)